MPNRIFSEPTITHLDKRWREKKHCKLKDLAAEVGQTFLDATPHAEVASTGDAVSAARAPAAAPLQRDRVRS